jgi:hypothetical protein
VFKHRLTFLLALLLLGGSHDACAYIDLPYITPAAPVAGDTVAVNIGYGICDAIDAVQTITQ